MKNYRAVVTRLHYDMYVHFEVTNIPIRQKDMGDYNGTLPTLGVNQHMWLSMYIYMYSTCRVTFLSESHLTHMYTHLTANTGFMKVLFWL